MDLSSIVKGFVLPLLSFIAFILILSYAILGNIANAFLVLVVWVILSVALLGSQNKICIEAIDGAFRVKGHSEFYPPIIKSIIMNSPLFSGGIKIYTENDKEPHVFKKNDIEVDEKILSVEGWEEEDEDTHETIFRTAKKYIIPSKRHMSFDEDFKPKKFNFPLIIMSDEKDYCESPVLILCNFDAERDELVKMIGTSTELGNTKFV